MPDNEKSQKWYNEIRKISAWDDHIILKKQNDSVAHGTHDNC